MSDDQLLTNHKDLVDWKYISQYQKLSEEFITNHKDLVYWSYISEYQKLSEDFITKYKKLVNWHNISQYQKLSEEFITNNKLTISTNNWLYKSTEDATKYIINNTKYQIQQDKQGKFIVAFKGIRSNRYSKYNFQYQYLKGRIYTCHADHNIDNDSSFGLSAWNKEDATDYCNELVVQVKIYIKDIAAIVHDNKKIRCSKFKVMG